MYVNLYPHKQLQKSVKFVGLLGMFLTAGGVYALIRELLLSDSLRVGWAISGLVILLAGFACFVIGSNRHIIREAYFSMSPECIKYRLALLAREQVIFWKDVEALEISAHAVIYNLTSGRNIKMRLGHIQHDEVALHVSRSIHLAALEKGIVINGVQTAKHNSVA
ncbi:hypothetical protein [Pontibacter sp. H249]|uniref:hypothetical protein n=1 Tax=Pontibacter sp. H249 TaxID=3133420 RepID=UPI0030C52480